MSNLKQVLAEIDLLKGKLDSLLPMKREDEERLWKKFRLEWNYNSNHIEGNTLTYGQTELLLIFDKTTGDHDMREYEEMKAHDVAIKLVREYAADRERNLTETDIREWNRIILVRPFWGNAITQDGQPTRKLIEPGVYKREPNSVRLQNGEIFHYASPEETPAKMQELVTWLKGELAIKEMHPVEIAAKLHYDFVRIHPFDDSNGRTARLLMNFVLFRSGYPPVVIKSLDKTNYLLALNKADTGDFASFAVYIAFQLKWSFDRALRAARGLDVSDPADLEKEIDVWLKGIKSSKAPRLSWRTFEDALGKAGAILQNTLDKLVAKFNSIAEIRLTITIGGYRRSHLVSISDTKVFLVTEPLHLFKLSGANANELDFFSSAKTIEFTQFFEGAKNENGEVLSTKLTMSVIFDTHSYSFVTQPEVVLEKEYLSPVFESDQRVIDEYVLRYFFDAVKIHLEKKIRKP